MATSPSPAHRHPCELFHNNRDGTFTDVAKESGLDVLGFVKGVASGDYDNDGRPDLDPLHRRRATTVLFHNDGPQRGRTAGDSPTSPQAGVESCR